MNRKVNLRKQRVFSEEFKKARVKEYEKGEFTVSEICELYHLHNTNVYDWIHKYSVYQDKQVRVVEMKDSSHKKVKDLQEKVKELERIVGQKQIEIDYLEKLIEIAAGEYKIDIKKNYGTARSGGSGKTGGK